MNSRTERDLQLARECAEMARSSNDPHLQRSFLELERQWLAHAKKDEKKGLRPGMAQSGYKLAHCTCQLSGQSGHGLLQCECLLLTQSGHPAPLDALNHNLICINAAIERLGPSILERLVEKPFHWGMYA